MKEQYQEHIFSLMNIPEAIFTLAPEANRVWDDFYNDIEHDLRQGEPLEHLKDWGSKLPGAVARIAGLLHCAEYGKRLLSVNLFLSILSAVLVCLEVISGIMP